MKLPTGAKLGKSYSKLPSLNMTITDIESTDITITHMTITDMTILT